jgi:DeoR/GlpR family transcriptional regulator of sugar metabolism
MGTTTLELARALSRKPWSNLHIVTNGIPILYELALVPGIRLICIGGMVDPDELFCTGYFSEQFLGQMNLSKLFLGCRGIDSEHGITNTLQAEKEIGIVRALVDRSARVILVADHSKFDQVFPMQVLAPSEIDVIVTDAGTGENVLKKFQEKGILIHISAEY